VQSIGYISTIKGINLLEDLIWFCGKSCGKIHKKLKTFLGLTDRHGINT